MAQLKTQEKKRLIIRDMLLAAWYFGLNVCILLLLANIHLTVGSAEFQYATLFLLVLPVIMFAGLLLLKKNKYQALITSLRVLQLVFIVTMLTIVFILLPADRYNFSLLLSSIRGFYCLSYLGCLSLLVELAVMGVLSVSYLATLSFALYPQKDSFKSILIGFMVCIEAFLVYYFITYAMTVLNTGIGA